MPIVTAVTQPVLLASSFSPDQVLDIEYYLAAQL